MEHQSGMVSMAELLTGFLLDDMTTDHKVILEARPLSELEQT